MFRSSIRSVSGPFCHYAGRCGLNHSVGHRVHSRPFLNFLFGKTSPEKTVEPGQASEQSSSEAVSTVKDDSSSPESKPETVIESRKLDESVIHISNDEEHSYAQSDDSTAAPASVAKTVQGSRGARKKKRHEAPGTAGKVKKVETQSAKKLKREPRRSQKTAARSRAQKIAEPPPTEQPAKKPKTQKKFKPERKMVTGSLKASDKALIPLRIETPPVPSLAYGLERVLYNPGVYQLRDPRSRVFNFDPYLGSIMPVTEFDFESLKGYITSSKDSTLRDIARKEGKKYVGSSSSMTSVLSHFHYLLSAWRPIDIRNLSQGFPEKLRSFTRLLRAPSAMFLLYQDGVYAVDADKEFESANILMNLGKSMEKLLTLPKHEFERYRRSSENKISPEEEQAIPESYHYSTIGDFVMRSQLDAYDPRLPGTGMFDLKTRAVVSIRMDAANFEHGVGYEIKGRYGNFESYEREFFDMIRAAFLKYSLQVRIGRMDGIFVAFHNIERIFGFQYISLPEMDQSLHGTSDTALGDREFQLSVELWNQILDNTTAKYPKQSLRFHFETRDTAIPTMYVFAEPVTDDEIHAIQTKNQDKVEAYQRRILNLEPRSDDSDASSVSPTTAATATIITATSAMDLEIETGAAEQLNDRAPSPQGTASQQTGPKKAATPIADSSQPSPDDEFIPGLEEEAQQEDTQDQREVYGIMVTIKNKINGVLTERPERLTPKDDWVLEYELCEMEAQQARTLYRMCQRRREKVLLARGEDDTDAVSNVYIRKLRELSKEGRKYRQEQDALDKKLGIVVLSDTVCENPADRMATATAAAAVDSGSSTSSTSTSTHTGTARQSAAV